MLRPLLASFALTLSFASAAEPALKQAVLNGLLVTEASNGKLAGAASRMNATVVSNGAAFELGFNQDVGEMMNKATDEIKKFISVRHAQALPAGYRIELAFADKYSPKDGPSAAVACALLADALIGGKELDDAFAVTGDMTAEGKVRPVGGVGAKLRGAIKAECKYVAVPAANASSVTDSYIIEGPKALYKTQILSIATFDEAHRLAVKTRAEDVQKALDEFSAVQQALGNNPAFVSHPKVQEKLRTVLKTLPNHLSAKLLLLHGMGQGPDRLSLPGSLLAIQQADQSFGSMLEDQSWLESGGSDDVLTGFISEMERLRRKLDTRTVDYGDSYHRLALYIKSIRGRRQFTAQMREELRAAVLKVQAQRKNLLSEPEVREELMLE
jgi:hypothetical protein